MQRVPLYLTPGLPQVYLRPLCGSDELHIDETSTVKLLSLLQSIISKTGNFSSDDQINVSKIVTADRDRIVAALYISLYGSKIESTLTCNHCKELFDLDFSLADLLAHAQPAPVPVPQDGVYEMETGIRFRLPNGEDEMAVTGSLENGAEKLLFKRCLLHGDTEKDMESVQVKMAELAPVLNLAMQAHCPECNNNQQVKFDMQAFLLIKLKAERQRLIQEIHHIASQYHWSHQSILQLPRKLRKQYVSLIESAL